MNLTIQIETCIKIWKSVYVINWKINIETKNLEIIKIKNCLTLMVHKYENLNCDIVSYKQ